MKKILSLCVLVLLSSQTARAEDLVGKTKDLIAKSKEVVAMTDKKAQLKNLCDLLIGNVDVEVAYQNTFADRLKTSDASVKKQVHDLFPSFMVNSYFRKLKAGINKVTGVDASPISRNNMSAVTASTKDGDKVYFYYSSSVPSKLIDMEAGGALLSVSTKGDFGSTQPAQMAEAMKGLVKKNLGECPAESLKGLTAQNKKVSATQTADASTGKNSDSGTESSNNDKNLPAY